MHVCALYQLSRMGRLLARDDFDSCDSSGVDGCTSLAPHQPAVHVGVELVSLVVRNGEGRRREKGGRTGVVGGASQESGRTSNLRNFKKFRKVCMYMYACVILIELEYRESV